MPSNYFNHHITLKTIVGIMDRFSNIVLERYNADSSVRKLISVPIQYGNREKFLQITKNTNLKTDLNEPQPEPETDILLPRIACLITAMNYDSIRHTAKTNKIESNTGASLYPTWDSGTDYVADNTVTWTDKNYVCVVPNTNQVPPNETYWEELAEKLEVYNPAPYNLEVEMTILTKTMDDGFQIVEQILPMFTPSLSIDIQYIENFPSESIPIILNAVVPDIPEEMGINDTRLITWILSFTIKVNYHLPRSPRKVITKITENFWELEFIDKFKTYEMTANSMTPTTTIEERNLEPTTDVITDYTSPD